MRRLIALIAGIAFFGVGIWLVVQGIVATGPLDIQSAFVSGKIQTGEARACSSRFSRASIIICASFGSDKLHSKPPAESNAG